MRHVGQLLLLAGLVLAGCGDPQPRWNLLIVTFDTTRADRLGCYGREEARTPRVDGLAAEGVVFERAYASVPVTLPSHTSLLTGLDPIRHGVRDNGQFVLPAEVETLAERLSAAGWATGAAIGGFPLVARFGLDQGFGLYDDRLRRSYETWSDRPAAGGLFYDERRAGLVNEAILPWISENATRPFFAWVHYYDPHHPHDPPPPYDEAVPDSYDAEIAYADESFGALLDVLEERGVADRTVVVLTSDHGEGVGQHREMTHSHLLYDATMRVPLVVRWPGGPRGVRVEERVRLVDIVPTALELLRLPGVEGLDGRSLVGLTTSAADRRARTHYAETLAPRLGFGWGELRALYDGPHKLIYGPRPELYDVASDPDELHDLIGEHPELAARLEEKLRTHIARAAESGASAAVPIDEETRRQLEALGYLQQGGESPEALREELRTDGAPPQDHVEISGWIAQAKNLLQQRRPVEAKWLALRLLDEDPGQRFASEVLLLASAQMGDLDGARDVLRELRGAHGDSDLVRRASMQVARQLYLGGRREEGLEMVREIAGGTDAEVEDFYYLAVLLADRGDVSASVGWLERALEKDPRHAPTLIDLGIRAAQAGRSEEAGAYFRRALESEPYSARAHFNSAVLLVEAGEPVAAHEHLDRALSIEPNYLEARAALVSLAVAEGDPEEARRELERLVEIAPRSPVTLGAKRMLAETGELQ